MDSHSSPEKKWWTRIAENQVVAFVWGILVAIVRWFGELYQWFVFSIVISFLPVILLSKLGSNPGLYHAFTDSLKSEMENGNLLIMAIPIIGGLIGESMIRKFIHKFWSITAVGLSLVLLAICLSVLDDINAKAVTLDAVHGHCITVWVSLLCLAALVLATAKPTSTA